MPHESVSRDMDAASKMRSTARTSGVLRRVSVAAGATLLGTSALLGVAPSAVAAGPGSAVLVGTVQDELGCTADWDPACDATALTDLGNGEWAATFTLPAGEHEVKVALDGSWDKSYGAGGTEGNIPLALAGPTTVEIRYASEGNRVSLALPEEDLSYDASSHPLPSPYRHPGGGQTFYFVLTDRFSNGDPSNDRGGIEGDRFAHGFDPTDKGFYHGGDIAGLRAQLDYIENLGMTSIWLTPSFKNNPVQGEGENASAGYHGYWVTDFTQLDPHLGTNEEFKDFIDDAHSRGIKVYFDIIVNHTADLIDYDEGSYSYIDQDSSPYLTAQGEPFSPSDYAQSEDFPTLDPAISFAYTPVRNPNNPRMVPEELNDVTMYHNRGNSTWSGESVTYGDFEGLDDLMTEDPRVLATMEEIYTTWMDFGIDGYRIDTAKHVDFGFWQQFTQTLVDHQVATPAGDQFFTFGEVYDADARLLSPYVRDSEMDSVLDFAYQSSATNFARGYSTAGLGALFDADDYYTTPDSSAADLPTFLGNHDMGRIGYLLQGSDDPAARSKLAHSAMLLTRGQPVIYYGDEQGFVGDGNDKDARSSMFPSQVDSYNDDVLIDGTPYQGSDSFDQNAQLYPLISELAQLRTSTPALNQGAQIELHRTDGAGIYATARVDREEKVEHVIALNNAASAQTATFSTLTPGATYTVLWSSDDQSAAGTGTGASEQVVAADPSGQITLTVPAFGSMVLVADQQVAPAGDAQAISLAPADGTVLKDLVPVQAEIAQDRWAETSFAWRLAGSAEWTDLGVAEDDTPRVFHDVSSLPTGTLVEYRAVSIDAAGATVVDTAIGVVGVDLSKDGATTGGDITAESVTLPGSHNAAMGCTADWQPDCLAAQMTYDANSDVFIATYDLPAGTYEYKVAIGGSWAENYGDGGVTDGPNITYTHAGGPITFWYHPTSHIVMNSAQGPLITLPGSFQAALGCEADWQPGCLRTWMMDTDGDGIYTFATDALPTGTYEVKVAHNGSWDENYGVDGAADGANYVFSATAGATVLFSYDLATNILTIDTDADVPEDPSPSDPTNPDVPPVPGAPTDPADPPVPGAPTDPADPNEPGTPGPDAPGSALPGGGENNAVDNAAHPEDENSTEAGSHNAAKDRAEQRERLARTGPEGIALAGVAALMVIMGGVLLTNRPRSASEAMH